MSRTVSRDACWDLAPGAADRLVDSAAQDAAVPATISMRTLHHGHGRFGVEGATLARVGC